MDHTRPLFRNERILTVINLYIFQCLLKLKSNLSDYNTGMGQHQYNTRNNFNLITPRVRLSKSKKWYSSIAVELFNKLPQSAFTVSMKRFKLCLWSWLVEHPFFNIQEFFDSQMDISF